MINKSTIFENDLTMEEYDVFTSNTQVYIRNILSISKNNKTVDLYRRNLIHNPVLSYRSLIISQVENKKNKIKLSRKISETCIEILLRKSEIEVLIIDNIWGLKNHLNLFLKKKWFTSLYQFDYSKLMTKIQPTLRTNPEKVESYFPIAQREAIDQLCYHAAKFLDTYPNLKFIISNNKIMSDDFWRLVSILARRKGIQTIILQHGGNYQTEASGTLQSSEMKLADNWFGWSIEQADSPAGIHSVLKVKKKSKIWYIVTTNWRIPAIDMPHPFMSKFDDHMEYQKVFLENCTCKLKKYLHVKLEPNDRGFDQNTFYLKYFEPQNMHRNKSIMNLLQDAKLLIFGYSSTVLYDALAANIPFVLYWDRSLWPWNDKFDDLLKKFQDNNIFFDNGEKLSIFLNENHDNIDEWWNSSERQEIIQEFKSNFRWYKSCCDEISALEESLNKL